MTHTHDSAHMRHALSLAGRTLGDVAPNPAVGCVLVQEDVNGGVVVGRGWTQRGGRPHAETQALAQAGDAAKGATAYVSLEPCAHQGETPPCADALVKAGVTRVVVGCEDPDPRVSGKGMASLREAGIEVECGVLEAECQKLNAGFVKRVTEGRPLIAVKVATSIDGRIATHTHDSQWITSELARRHGHMLRAAHDAIMVGSNTALMDDPSLDCRLAGVAHRSPLRIVFDGRLRLPLTSQLVRTAKDRKTLLVTLDNTDAKRREAYQDCGLEVVAVKHDATGQIDLGKALGALGERGLTRVLVEGGGHLIASLMAAKLVDRFHWYRSPKVIGGDGIPALQGFGVDLVEEAPGLLRTESVRLGEDLVETFDTSR